MKKYTSYILGFLLGFLVLTGIVFAASIWENFSFKNNDTLCGNHTCQDTDNWKFSLTDIKIFNSETDSYRNTAKNFRGILQGKISSELYGAFEIQSEFNNETGLALFDIQSGSLEKKCGESQHTYKIEGMIHSSTFGKLEVIGEKSIFCPASLEAFIVFSSPKLPKKLVLYSQLDNDEEEVEQNMSIEFSTSTVSNIFEKQQVLIIGSSKIQGNLDGLLNESGNVQINEIHTASSIAPLIRADINKKVAELTRNLTPLNPDPSIVRGISFTTESVETNGEKIYYYDYSNTPHTSDNGYNNKGKTVTIQNSGVTKFLPTKPSSYTLEISDKKILIVKGANVYINADIHNRDDATSLLTIVTQRDENNNGGNIYIDPDVTNIDAILIADGSVLSYRDGKGILNRSVNKGSILARQLYIYGALYSRNTIGSEKVPFGSDKNLFEGAKSFTSIKENIYDLSNLRGFQMRYAAPEKSLNDCGGFDIINNSIKRYWVPGYTTNTSGEEKLDETLAYAWAGKRKCFNPDINTNITGLATETQAQGSLRTIGQANSVIIEYNPAMKNNIPYVLQK